MGRLSLRIASRSPLITGGERAPSVRTSMAAHRVLARERAGSDRQRLDGTIALCYERFNGEGWVLSKALFSELILQANAGAHQGSNHLY